MRPTNSAQSVSNGNGEDFLSAGVSPAGQALATPHGRMICEVIDLDEPTKRMYEYAPAWPFELAAEGQDGGSSCSTALGLSLSQSQTACPKAGFLHPSSIAGTTAAGTNSQRSGNSEVTRSIQWSGASATDSRGSGSMNPTGSGSMEPSSSRGSGRSRRSSRGVRRKISYVSDKGARVEEDVSYVRHEALTASALPEAGSHSERKKTTTQEKKKWSARIGDALSRLVTAVDYYTTSPAPDYRR
mmetsp:Transcript_28255/g.65359  ORF Transcript_28255/g.65359 Transcript_28255/m.65359 type:complete len:243 (-) Transcript_28255:73-801(-)